MNGLLKDILHGKVVIVGIGNTLRGDDGFGPSLIGRLKDNIKAVCLDAGSVPENYTDIITKERPDTILLVDAVHLGLKPGKYRVLRKTEIVKSGFTTHDISPTLFIEYLEGQTKADIYMLGVQPQNLSLGDEMCESVKRALVEIEKLLTEAINA